MILISNQTIGLWSIYLTDRADFLCHLRQTGQAEFRIEARTRFYDSNNPDPWSGRDQKQWMKATLKNVNRAEALRRVRQVISDIEETFGQKADEILMSSSKEEFLRELKKRDWAHLKLDSEIYGENDEQKL